MIVTPDKKLDCLVLYCPVPILKLREAMTLYDTPDFPRKALPLLREAVAADALNDQAQFWLGVAWLLAERDTEALAPLEAAVRLAPADLRYQQYLVFAYLKVGDPGRAMALLAEGLSRR